jgi:hypothetical protein
MDNESQSAGQSKPHNDHIDIDDPGDLRRWSKELKVDERTLRVAVKTAGAWVKAVRHYLSTSRKLK